MTKTVEKVAAHTPGPWRVIHDGIIGVQIGHWGGVALPDSDSHDREDTARANARLIAAAPELLSALKAVAAWRGLDGDGITDPVRQQVLDAISKAEGR